MKIISHHAIAQTLVSWAILVLELFIVFWTLDVDLKPIAKIPSLILSFW